MKDYNSIFFKYWEENKPKDTQGNYINFKDWHEEMKTFLNIIEK
jgi:hypothetical protein